MLTQEFDRETMRYLSDILAQENTTCDELICNLIRDRWLLLQQTTAASSASNQTVDHPELSRPELGRIGITPVGFIAADFNLACPGAELPPSEVELLGAPVSHPAASIGHRPRNPKQALADFVKRRNQRVCVF